MKILKKTKIRLLSFLVIILLIVSFGTQNIISQASTLGDVNSDGSIDIVDALLTAQYYVGLDPDNFNAGAADVDGNGSIDIVDALLIAQYYVGLIDEFPGQGDTPTTTPTPDSSGGYSFTGVLNNGYINGSQVSYTTTAAFDGTNVTVTFDGGPGFEWVWLYTPDHHNLTNTDGNLWSATLSGYSDGDTLEYYFIVRKDGQEANNNDAPHVWVVGSGSPTLTPTPTFDPTPVPGGNWVIVWEDNFNCSGQPDPSNWNYHAGNGYNTGSGLFDGWGNGEWEWYRPGNAYQEGGNLVIKAEYHSSPTSIRGRDWYQFSARLTTQGKRSWQYGRLEARIAMPSAPGTWPAFWMMGTSCDASYTSDYNPAMSHYDTMASNWASCGELDIIEHRNTESVIVQNLFWDTRTGVYEWQDGSNASDPSENIQVGDVTQFHLYTLEWDANECRWYVDRESNPDPTKIVSITASNQEEFNKPFFLILNLAIQGQFTGPTDPDQGDFPLYMYVDYVRVWQQQ